MGHKELGETPGHISYRVGSHQGYEWETFPWRNHAMMGAAASSGSEVPVPGLCKLKLGGLCWVCCQGDLGMNWDIAR